MKGDNHTIIGNLALDTFNYPNDKKDVPSLKVVHILREATEVTNEYTTVTDNAATRADGGKDYHTKVKPKLIYPLAGKKTNNYVGEDLRHLLVDVKNKDLGLNQVIHLQMMVLVNLRERKLERESDPTLQWETRSHNTPYLARNFG